MRGELAGHLEISCRAPFYSQVNLKTSRFMNAEFIFHICRKANCWSLRLDCLRFAYCMFVVLLYLSLIYFFTGLADK